MNGSIYLTAFGAAHQQTRLEVCANNIANMNTPGFKADRMRFRLPVSDHAVGDDPSPMRLVVPESAQYIDFSQGAVVPTGNPLDMAITGKGFFTVQTPEGLRYTRHGRFSLNEDGVLVTSQGFPVLGDGGEIRLDGDRVEIGTEGDITLNGVIADRLQIVDFPTSGALQKMGDSLFAARNAGATEQVATEAKIQQGAYEAANVNAVKMMTELIDTLRAFEFYQKAIQSVDGMNGKAVNAVGALK